MATATDDKRTEAQRRVGAIHAYDRRNLTEAEAEEALANARRISVEAAKLPLRELSDPGDLHDIDPDLRYVDSLCWGQCDYCLSKATPRGRQVSPAIAEHRFSVRESRRSAGIAIVDTGWVAIRCVERWWEALGVSGFFNAIKPTDPLSSVSCALHHRDAILFPSRADGIRAAVAAIRAEGK